MIFDQLKSVSITYSRRKTIGIYVSAEKGVEVRAPHFVSKREAMAFVAAKQDWIEQQLQAIAQRPARFEPTYDWGGTIYFLGEPQRFHHQAEPCEQGAVDLVLKGSASEPPERIQKRVETWFRKQALALFQERHALWSERMAGLGIPDSTVTLRAMKRRWGTCRKNGSIILNTHLAKYPLECVDVVVVHELCHLLEFNHSRRFYDLMTQVMPDWKRYDRLLNDLSLRY